jgi:hypothetical protein
MRTRGGVWIGKSYISQLQVTMAVHGSPQSTAHHTTHLIFSFSFVYTSALITISYGRVTFLPDSRTVPVLQPRQISADFSSDITIQRKFTQDGISLGHTRRLSLHKLNTTELNRCSTSLPNCSDSVWIACKSIPPVFSCCKGD